MNKIIFLLSLILSLPAFGVGQTPRTDALESGVGVTYVGVNPQVGGASPFQLTIAHKRHQVLNPAGAITVKLPSVGVSVGDTWKITNRSVNKVTIQDSSAFYLNEITFGTIELVALASTPTGTGTWLVIDASSDWVSYTPTGANQWTGNASYSGKTRRSKDTMHLQNLITGGAQATGGDTGNTKFYLPTSNSIDFVKLANNNTNGASVGQASGTSTSNWSGDVRTITNTTVDQLNVWSDRNSSTGSDIATSQPLSPSILGAGAYHVSINATVPITEWKMNP